MNVLMNNVEHIFTQRVNVFDNSGNVIGAENLAFAMGGGERLKWVVNKLTDRSMWVRVDSQGNAIQASQGKAFQWLDGDWLEVTFQG